MSNKKNENYNEYNTSDFVDEENDSVNELEDIGNSEIEDVEEIETEEKQEEIIQQVDELYVSILEEIDNEVLEEEHELQQASEDIEEINPAIDEEKEIETDLSNELDDVVQQENIEEEPIEEINDEDSNEALDDTIIIPNNEEVDDVTKVFTTIKDESAGMEGDASNVEETTDGAKKKMAKKTGARKVKKKKKADKLGFNWFFWISFVLIAIPVGYFIYLLVVASSGTGTPVIGDRITDTVYQEIEETSLTNIVDDIAEVDGIESYTVNLAVQTLRITVNGVDELTEEDLQVLAQNIYDIVNEELPIETYFTEVDEYKQYDLEIYVYNFFDDSEDSSTSDTTESEESSEEGEETTETITSTIVILSKNAMNEEITLQTLTSAVNQDVADELRALAENGDEEESSEDYTIGGSGVEDGDTGEGTEE